MTEAEEQAELQRRRDMEANRDPATGVPQGWIGPVEAGRRDDKIRELRARIRELSK